MMAISGTEVSLGQQLFGQARLGDRRRSARMAAIFDLMQRHPGGSLPDKLTSPPDLRAFYRLCNCPAVTHAAIIEAVRDYTTRRIKQCDDPVLLLHDATELDYTSHHAVTGELAQIGTGTGRGFICQNVLAVNAVSGEVLGLMDQILHLRDEVPDNETLEEHRQRETRESLLWLRGTDHLPAELNEKVIDVSDQGSDTFEFLEHEYQSGRGFVIRACKKRKVYAGHEATGRTSYLKDYAHSLPELGRFTMDVQSQKGRSARKQAEFTIRGGAVLICPPHARHGNHGQDPLPLYVVQITEQQPPNGEKAIDWMLVTNRCVSSLSDAWEVSEWYERRWIVEEFHKAQKTGCQVEEMQFTTRDRLEPAIAVLSMVAVTLLNLRDASRQADARTRLATTVIAPDYVTVLSVWRHGSVRPGVTVHDFFLMLARLGGHQNRRSDKRPGWLILWRGWTRLQAMLDGYDAANRTKCGKT